MHKMKGAPTQKVAAPSKADQIKAQVAEAKAAKENAWPAYWAHRKDHITKGENKGGTPVGYHTKVLEGKGAVCKTIGEATPIPNSGGCYKQTVTVLSAEKGAKSKESTFFPSTFTLQDIEAVCKSAYLSSGSQDMSKNFSSKSSVDPGKEMKLNFTADSIYPQYDK